MNKLETQIATKYKLHTSLSVSGANNNVLKELATRLSEALYAVSAGYPTMDAYFVEPSTIPGELEVGIRFDGTNERYAEDLASDILNDALKIVSNKGSEFNTDLQQESSLLTPA